MTYMEPIKRTRLSYSQRVELLNRLEAGANEADLQQEYGISRTSMFNIKKNSVDIRKINNSPVGAAFRVFLALDKRMLRWIARKRELGVQLAGPQVCKMARTINERLGAEGRADFKASNGWLQKFTQRYSIRLKPVDAQESAKEEYSGIRNPLELPTPVVKSLSEETEELRKKAVYLNNLRTMKYGKRRGKAKNVEEIDKPRGFDRGLELDRILGAANLGKTPITLHFLVRWIGCDELDLIPGPEMNEKLPDRVIAYYENLSPINKQFEIKEKERLAIALRPVIVSKVEQMMQSESVSNEELFRAVVEEATDNDETAAMVQIPQDYNNDLVQPSMEQGDDMNWVAEEQVV